MSVYGTYKGCSISEENEIKILVINGGTYWLPKIFRIKAKPSLFAGMKSILNTLRRKVQLHQVFEPPWSTKVRLSLAPPEARTYNMKKVYIKYIYKCFFVRSEY